MVLIILKKTSWNMRNESVNMKWPKSINSKPRFFFYMCDYKKVNPITGIRFKNFRVLASESLLMIQKDCVVFTCVGPEQSPVGHGHCDHTEHKADDADQDHGPAVGGLALLRPAPIPGSWSAWPPVTTSHCVFRVNSTLVTCLSWQIVSSGSLFITFYCRFLEK